MYKLTMNFDNVINNNVIIVIESTNKDGLIDLINSIMLSYSDYIWELYEQIDLINGINDDLTTLEITKL